MRKLLKANQPQLNLKKKKERNWRRGRRKEKAEGGTQASDVSQLSGSGETGLCVTEKDPGERKGPLRPNGHPLRDGDKYWAISANLGDWREAWGAHVAQESHQGAHGQEGGTGE